MNISLITIAVSLYHNISGKKNQCSYNQGNYVFEKLHLDKKSRDNIRIKAKQFHHTLDKMEAETKSLNRRLIKEIYSSDTSNDTIYKLIDEISEKQKSIQKLIVNHLFEIKKELNAEQRARFFKLIENAFVTNKGVH